MFEKEFIGLNGFVWWIGVVEKRNDPLKLGRLKVRIYGWHSDNVNLLPTDDLPWAQVLVPVNNAKTYSGPKEGEWVAGYFLDGENAQQPVVFGVFPGIVSEEQYKFKPKAKAFVDKRTQEEIDKSPKQPSDYKDGTVGEPTNPRLYRGIVEGTGEDSTNKKRSHVCDVTPEVQRIVALTRIQFGQFIDQVRQAIRALLKSLGLEPSGELSKAVSIAKSIAQEIKKIRDVIEEINDYATVILTVVRKIRALIDYILSLPERIRRFVSDCLTAFFSAIAAGVGDLIGGISETGGQSSFGELVSAIREVQSATTELVGEVYTLASLPAATVAAITTPASASEVDAAAKSFDASINTIFPSAGDSLTTNTYSAPPGP